MDIYELKELLADKTAKRDELPNVEFKETADHSFFESICAFANTDGGVVLLGVDKNGAIAGVKPTSKYLDMVTDQIDSLLSIHPKIEVIDNGGKRVIAITVDRSVDHLVSYKGRYWERVGATDRKMGETRLRERLTHAKTWDSLLTEHSFDEIDVDTLDHFIKQAVAKGRLAQESLNDYSDVLLEKLNLVSNGSLTNGALLLFGKNPQKYYVNLKVRLGRFKTDTEIIDDKWAGGNLFYQLDSALTILRQYISVRYKIEAIEREEVWEYPLLALREGLLNALMHRDYFNIANFIQINVYEDHIWIANPGGLPNGLTVEDLKRPHKSYLRNPLIAHVLFLAGHVEQYGTGTTRIIEWMKEAGLPEPEFKEEMGGFSVYLYKDMYAEEMLKRRGLTDRQITAVMYAKEKGKITNEEYQEINQVSRQTASRELAVLSAMHVLDRIGKTGKFTYYKLTATKINNA